MANWQGLKDFIKGKYNLQSDNGESFTLVLNITGTDRSQLVIVSSVNQKDGTAWARISSPIGSVNDISNKDLVDILEFLGDYYTGGLVKYGDRYFVRHCMQLADLSDKEFLVPMDIVAIAADTIEQKFVGGDKQ
jgi:hypothetical protein